MTTVKVFSIELPFLNIKRQLNNPLTYFVREKSWICNLRPDQSVKEFSVFTLIILFNDLHLGCGSN